MSPGWRASLRSKISRRCSTGSTLISKTGCQQMNSGCFINSTSLLTNTVDFNTFILQIACLAQAENSPSFHFPWVRSCTGVMSNVYRHICHRNHQRTHQTLYKPIHPGYLCILDQTTPDHIRPHYQETSLSFRLLHSLPPWPMTNRPWPGVSDNPDHPKQLNLTTLTKESRKWCIVYFGLFSIFSLIASLELRFLSLKIFFMHFENGKDLVVRNPNIFCTNAILLWCKSNLNVTWNDRGIKKTLKKFQTKTISGVPVRGFQTQYLYSRSWKGKLFANCLENYAKLYKSTYQT